MSWRVRLRMSEPKGHWQISDSSVVLDLTFALRTRRLTEANVKSTTLAASLELVAEAGTRGVDSGADAGRKADIFPFGAHEEAADQVDVHSETSCVAVDQVAMHRVGCCKDCRRTERLPGPRRNR